LQKSIKPDTLDPHQRPFKKIPGGKSRIASSVSFRISTLLPNAASVVAGIGFILGKEKNLKNTRMNRCLDR
jgi:hypothetical protein